MPANAEKDTTQNGSPNEIAVSSFFDYLTDIDSADGFRATDVIKYLIQTIGHDACSVKRNSLSTYELVQAARENYEAINGLIRLVDTDGENTWENFLKYTKAIDPLEEYIFQFFFPR